MEVQSPQFAGAPCGQYGTHTFYKSFKFSKNGKNREIGLGEFFFIRISSHEDPCIGELQLLCSSRNNEQHDISAIRLYFLPEQTPDGRLSHHGEDEVLVASTRVVLKLDDLVGWITEEVEWSHGIIAPGIYPADKTANDTNNNDTSVPQRSSPDTSKDIPLEEGPSCSSAGEDATRVLVLSYLKYCRYRCMLKRLEGGDTSTWLRNSLVLALGGFVPPPDARRTHILFCRDSFEHEELANLELNCEYLAPSLKQKRRKKKTKNTRSISPESITSEDNKELIKADQKTNGLKQPPIKNEQEFLQRLFKFMKKRNTPIHRVPNLGFKQIDLYIFWSFAQKLGGYDKVTGKKLWKHVYDELGGNPGSTSAATCTRRHYEKLLLPFERFMAGIIYKPTPRAKKPLKVKTEDKIELMEDNKIKADTATVPSSQVEDAYVFTDSNHENSNSVEDISIIDDQTLTNDTTVFSDEDSKTVWSIQKQPDTKDETDKDDGKPIKPLIIQKGQSETFAEKERKWDEIRKKNAAARKWVRQSRSARGSKSTMSEKSVSTEEISNTSPTKADVPLPPEKVKVEISDETISQNEMMPPDVKLLDAKPLDVKPLDIKPLDVKPPDVKANILHQNSVESFVPPTTSTIDAKIKLEKPIASTKKLRLSATDILMVSPEKKCSLIKQEILDPRPRSAHSVHSEPTPTTSSLPSPTNMYNAKNKLSGTCKPVGRLEPEYSSLSGRHSVGSISVSSAVSAEGQAPEKLVPQRRPSVIQHTEHAATSPSPSLSPKQSTDRNFSPKEAAQAVSFPSPKGHHLPSQYSMTGKVAEWLTKGVHEVVACKTPSTVTERTMELHDKVMMPSSCKTPGAVGTSKVPVSNTNTKTKAVKSPRTKYSGRHRNSDVVVNGHYNIPKTDARNNTPYPKLLHPVSSAYSVISNPGGVPVYRQSPKSELYPNGPYYSQPKRHKISNTAISMLPSVPARPSMSPFVRQQTYCTPPLSDIPKATVPTHNDYDSAVLDLSVKKRPLQTPKPIAPVPVSISPPLEEGVCLDLSVKKKPNLSVDNGIENITPPLPLSPNPPQVLPYIHHPIKPLPTLISIQDLAAERGGYTSNSRLPPVMTSTVTSPAPGPPLMHSSSTMFTGSTHTKLPPGLMQSVAYSKELAKSLYMPSNSRHAQFSPYVIPPFFPANWTSVVNTSAMNSKHTGNSQPSPMAYKGVANHNIFPKDYPFNSKSQFHPVLCKDTGHYAANGKK